VRQGLGWREIGAIGVRISSGITCHGLAFNIDNDLSWYENIMPYGIEVKGVTSLRREVSGELPSDVIHDQLIHCLARIFWFSDMQIKRDFPVL
jgi:lipoyl(octanoyl) transferase 2